MLRRAPLFLVDGIEWRDTQRLAPEYLSDGEASIWVLDSFA